eukprot:gene11445-2083_t
MSRIALAWFPKMRSPEVTPWPYPTTCTNGTASLVIPDPKAGITITSNSASQILQRAAARVTAAIASSSPHAPVAASSPGAATAVTLTVSVNDSSEDLSDMTDESYTLSVLPSGSASAHAATVFGALHALESFSQLFESCPEGLQLRGLPWTIQDAPRFSHRGMLIDTSRHWLPLQTIRDHIDTMAMSKLNPATEHRRYYYPSTMHIYHPPTKVLHLHLVDFQSFPFASAAGPALVKGAWSASETYSPADLSALTAYAKS